MPDQPKPPAQAPANLGSLQTQVKSQILQRISDNFSKNLAMDGTQYTKSDGTNYGMYQKSDDFSAVSDIWDRVFPAANVSRTTISTLPTGTVTPKTGG